MSFSAWSLTCSNSTLVNLANDGAMLSFGPYQLQMGELDYYGQKVFSPNYDCTPLMGYAYRNEPRNFWIYPMFTFRKFFHR